MKTETPREAIMSWLAEKAKPMLPDELIAVHMEKHPVWPASELTSTMWSLVDSGQLVLTRSWEIALPTNAKAHVV